jgi:hypothetical protein
MSEAMGMSKATMVTLMTADKMAAEDSSYKPVNVTA